MENTTEKKADFIETEIDLNVSDDNMKVYLSCHADFSNTEIITNKILLRLEERKITAKPDLILIEKAIEKAKETGEDIKDLLIIQGRPPVMPVDGKIEWTGNYFDERYYVDPETKKIDYKQKIEDRCAEENQLLVKVTPAQNGKDGRDIFGKAIVVKSPKKIHLKGGPNVVWAEEESGYKSKCAGRVKLRGGTLDVDPIYHIAGGVGNESGNIKHNGQVVIDGDVEADFKVEAAGDIEVRGLIYACDIICGGNLSSKEGINSNLTKKIYVKGDIVAKYIMNATIVCDGNINVLTEIFNSNIETKGEINCGGGRIVGGETLATKGITINEAGSKGNTETILIAGLDKKLQAKLKTNTDEIGRLKEMMKKLEIGYRKFKANIQLLSNEQKEGMTAIQYKIAEGEEEIERINKENKTVVEKIRENSNALIKVREIIRPGVVLRIGDTRHVVDQPLAGPIYIGQDRYTREIKLTSKLDEFESEENNNNHKSE